MEDKIKDVQSTQENQKQDNADYKKKETFFKIISFRLPV